MRSYTEEDENYIRDNYGELPTEVIAKELGRSENNIRNFARRNGIEYQDNFTKAIQFRKNQGFKSIADAIHHYGDTYNFKVAYLSA